MRDHSDEALLDAWQTGDNHAGSLLFRRHIASMQRFFRNKVAAQDEDDLIQSVFLGCVKGAAGFRGDASFRTYLFRVARNTLADYYDHKKRRPQAVDLDQVSVADMVTGPSTIRSRNRQQALLLDGLRAIPVHDQEVLELYYWEKMTAPQIGEVLELPEPAVRSRLRRAKERLVRSMEQRASSPEELRLTLDGFDRWADELRAQIAGNAQADNASDAAQP